jgi:alkylhydroperoxidase family enzyme
MATRVYWECHAMPRLREVPRKEATNPYVLLMYEKKFGNRDFVTAPGILTGAVGDAETVLANVPDIMEHVVRGFAMIRSPNRQIDPLLRELALTRVGWACGCQFVYSQHCKVMRSVGGTDEQVAAIPHWEISDLFRGVQRTVLAYADCLALMHGRVPEPIFDDLKRNLSTEAILELTYIASMYVMHATMLKALRVEFDNRDDPIVEVPAPNGYVIDPNRTLELPDQTDLAKVSQPKSQY